MLQCHGGGSVYSLAVTEEHIICGTYENKICVRTLCRLRVHELKFCVQIVFLVPRAQIFFNCRPPLSSSHLYLSPHFLSFLNCLCLSLPSCSSSLPSPSLSLLLPPSPSLFLSLWSGVGCKITKERCRSDRPCRNSVCPPSNGVSWLN